MDCRARFLGAVKTTRTPRSLRWATILPAEPTLARERCVCRGGRRGGVSSRCSARFSAGAPAGRRFVSSEDIPVAGQAFSDSGAGSCH